MFRKLTITAVAIATLATGSAFAITSAAPKASVEQPFSEKLASGLATLMMKGIAAGYAAKTGIDVAAAADDRILVQVNFEVSGDYDAFEEKMEGFAPFLSNTQGMVWKVWSLDRDKGRANGTYMFTSRAHADLYMSEILPVGMGNDPTISNIETRYYDILETPSRITHTKF